MPALFAAGLVAALAPGCITGEDWDDEGQPDGGEPDAGGEGERELVPVSHDRELRGVWIATVYNINFPSRSDLPADAQKAELLGMLESIERAGLNAVFFQVRPEGDAVYESSLEPWSRFLTGTQGQSPGYDPLAFLIEEAHTRNIEVHAWLNPYRAKVNNSAAAVDPHVAVTMPEHMREYGSLLWMDPGAEAVRDHTISVVLDLVQRYDIDGIHFDDYFYPYPDGTEFPDDETYDAYVDAGGTMERDDWRRDNVNRLIARLSEEIADEAPRVRFGISPFGIYRPGIPEGITGLDQYAALFADPVTWMEEGWLDYVAPQLYWNSTRPEQDYGTLLAWWSGLADDGRHVFAGNYLAMLGSEEAWSVDEYRQQLVISRAHRDEGSMGNIFYHIDPLHTGRQDIDEVLRDEYYATPALTPPVAIMRDVAVSPPEVELDGEAVRLSHPDRDILRAWVVYRQRGGGFEGDFEIEAIVPAARDRIELGEGTWAISAAGRSGVESLGRRLEL